MLEVVLEVPLYTPATIFQQITEFSKIPFNELGTSLHNFIGLKRTRVFGFGDFDKHFHQLLKTDSCISKRIVFPPLSLINI